MPYKLKAWRGFSNWERGRSLAVYVSQPTQGSVFGVPCQHSHARLCCTRLKDLFTILFVSLGYSFESRPYSRALGTEGSVVTRGLSINRCSRGLRQLRRIDANQAEPCFLLLIHEDKKWLYELVSPRGELQDLLIQWAGRYMFFGKIIKISLNLLKFYNYRNIEIYARFAYPPKIRNCLWNI